jgi:hypothetical protein
MNLFACHPSSRGLAAGFLALSVLMASLTGCNSLSGSKLVTPDRVRAVASLAAYYGAKRAVADGYRDDVARGVVGLQTILSADEPDIGAIVIALSAAQLNLPSGVEGEFLIGTAAIIFQDLWAESGQVVLRDQYVKAFLEGVIRGASLALKPRPEDTRALGGLDPIAVQLEAEARKTR